jgi:glycosyltransferase involved in cell wall biosynthesis
MVKAPWLSVVIPVFRAEHSVSDAIASVTDQDIDGVEIICVDDCSPDNSWSVLESLQRAHPSLRLIRQETNQGPGPTRNTGIEAADGDYVLLLDSDDSLIEGSLHALHHTLATTPADMVFIGCEEVRRGKARSLTDGALRESLVETGSTSVDAEPRILFWPPAPWSKVYRREFLNHHPIRFGGGVAEDIPWSARVTLLAKTVALCPAPVYRYVTAEQDSSVTTTTSEKNMAIVGQVTAMREQTHLRDLSPLVVEHLAALAAIHLIWPNRAAYRLLPEHLREWFFRDCAAELSAWLAQTKIPPHLDSRPLMGALERTLYVEALASGDWARWQRVLDQEARRKTFRRFFRPGRVFGKK